jgi:broad specificity phosphatase PhoE
MLDIQFSKFKGDNDCGMTKLYLIRHGENKANLTREFSHRLVDYPLTPRGILQAQQTAAYFRSFPIRHIYASPLKRAMETAAIIAQPLELEVRILEHFREINVGILEQQPTAENWELHDRIFYGWLEGQTDVTFPEGENYITLFSRMSAGLQEVITHDPEGPHIIVGHGGIFKATIRDICHNMDVTLLKLSTPNCAITEIDVQMQKGRPMGILHRWADDSHLSGEALPPQRSAPEDQAK